MRSLTAVLLTTCLLACGRSPSALSNSHGSAESLARAVLSALERRDVSSLNTLALNEQEFSDHVWAELPAARPERNLPISFVWGDLHQKSDANLRQTIAKHGGSGYDLVSIRFGGSTDYRSYRVHRDSEVTVTDREGRKQDLRLFGSVLEKEGRFKVFSYVVDD
jgi:hypothetical protein